MVNLLVATVCAGWFGYALGTKDREWMVFSFLLACVNLGIGLYLVN